MKVKHVIMLAVVFVIYIISLYLLLRKHGTGATSDRTEDIPNKCEYVEVQHTPAETTPVIPGYKRDPIDYANEDS